MIYISTGERVRIFDIMSIPNNLSIFELKQKEQEIENKISTCKDVYQKEIASRNLITETFKNVEKNNSNFKTEYKKNLKKDKND